MLGDDEVQQDLRLWAALVAGLSLFNIVWILKLSLDARFEAAGGPSPRRDSARRVILRLLLGGDKVKAMRQARSKGY
jgi:hypothetical protein